MEYIAAVPPMVVLGLPRTHASTRNPQYDPNAGRNSWAARSVRVSLRLLLAIFIAGASLLAPSRSYAQVCEIKSATQATCLSPGAPCNAGGGAKGTCRQLSDECECYVPQSTPGECGPQPLIPCTNYQCVNSEWKTFFKAGACTVGGQNGECAACGLAPSQAFYCAGPYTIHAEVSGLNSGNTLVLGEASDAGCRVTVSVTTNGTFVFPVRPLNGEPYGVSVLTQPAGQSCAVGSNGSGTMNGASVTVPVMCLSTSSWVPIGPAPVANPGPGEGGNAGAVNVAAADPTNAAVIYLGGAGGGIWKTSNAGAETPVWQPLTDNVPATSAPPKNQASLQVGGSPHSLSVHPANDSLIQGVVYYSGAGVLQSSQAGAPGSWSLLGSSQFDHQGMSAIAVHPTKQQVAYVATGVGLYNTTDGGQTWTLVAGLPTSGVYDVIYARFNPKVLFVSVQGNSGPAANLNGVYRSIDGGTKWKLLTKLPNSALSQGTYPNDVDGAIQMDTGPNKAVYVSMLTVGNDPSNPGKFAITAVQRFQSLDRGDTWTALAASPGGLETRSWHQLIAVDPQNDQHLFVNDSYSLYESTNGGQAWARADVNQQSSIFPNWGGGIGYDWKTVSFDANDKVLATADQGIFRYDPLGTVRQNWNSLIGNLKITTFYTTTLNTQTIAGTAQDQYGAMAGNNAQLDAVWQYTGTGGETGKVLLPATGTGYAYVYNPLDGNNNLVWRTQLTPQTPIQPSTQWTPIFTQNIYGLGNGNNYGFAYTSQKAFVMDPYNVSRLLAGADQVYETTSADRTSPPPMWSAIGPLPPPVPAGTAGSYVTAIAIAPSASNYVYVATSDNHVWVTQSDGRSSNGQLCNAQLCDGWTENDSGMYDPQNIGAVVSMSVDPNNPQHAFAVTSQWWGTSQVWELGQPSPSGQQTWVSRSGPGNLTVFSIFVNWRYSPPNLYIGTDRGVFSASNSSSAASWTPFGSGLPNVQVFDLQSAPWATLPPTTVLAAATFGRSAFEIALVEPPTTRPSPALRRQAAPGWVPPMRPPWAEGRQGIPPRPPAPPPKP